MSDMINVLEYNGWSEKYTTDPKPHIDKLISLGYQVNKFAADFLTKFGGLNIEFHNFKGLFRELNTNIADISYPYREFFTEEFIQNKCLCATSRSDFGEYIVMCVSDSGRYYLVIHEGETFEFDDDLSALDAIFDYY